MNTFTCDNVLYTTNEFTNYSPTCYVCSNFRMANIDLRSRPNRKAFVDSLEPVEFFRVTGTFSTIGVLS